MKAKDKVEEEAEDSDSSSSSSLPSLEEDEEAGGGEKSVPKKKTETSEPKAKRNKVNNETANFTTICVDFLLPEFAGV